MQQELKAVETALVDLLNAVRTLQAVRTDVATIPIDSAVTSRQGKRPQPASDHLTPIEAAALIGVSSATLATWRCIQRQRQPPYHKIGRNVWYRKSALEQWLTRQDRAA
ncbi:helix-turn-helix domain-containing protein [bacterium]|nr:helix-turn-helix domain-containing protein [bacterium]